MQQDKLLFSNLNDACHEGNIANTEPNRNKGLRNSVEQFYTTDLGSSNTLAESALRHLNLKQLLTGYSSSSPVPVNHTTKNH